MVILSLTHLHAPSALIFVRIAILPVVPCVFLATISSVVNVLCTTAQITVSSAMPAINALLVNQVSGLIPPVTAPVPHAESTALAALLRLLAVLVIQPLMQTPLFNTH